VTFRRLPDHQWGHVLIERDDHVVYRMHAGPITSAMPHDLVHYTVEDAMDLADGIWGAIAGGIVWRSMTHVSGRRPPHAEERSSELKRLYRDRVQYAEALGGFVEAAAHRPDAELAVLARQRLIGRPLDDRFLTAAATAVAAVRRAEQQWRELPIGAELVLTWPARRKVAPPRAEQRRAGRRGRGTPSAAR
jgi:hypothetical protein